MKIFKMIFHIALMAIVVFVLGYCLGLPMHETELKVDKKLGRRQEVVSYKGVSKEITDQYIEKYLVPIDEKIDYDSIVYYNEEEILYNGEGYELGRNGSQYMIYSFQYYHNLSHLVEAYPDPILRDCGNGYYYAMYHTEYNNRLYVFMTTEESKHNQYMETIGYPIVMTEKLSYSDFCGIKKHDSIDRVAEVDSVIELYKNCREMPTTTMHLLTDGMLQINYRVKYGEYLVDEIIYDEDYFGIYKVYSQDYMPRKKGSDKGVNYKKLWDIKLDNGLEITDTSYNTTWKNDDVYIRLSKYTGRSFDDITGNMETVRISGSTYFCSENGYFWDGPDGSGKTYERRVISKRGKHIYMVCASGEEEESLEQVPLEMLVDIIYNYDKVPKGLEKFDEMWTVSYSDGRINGYISINVAAYGINKYEDLRNSDEFELKKENGVECYITKERETDDEPNRKMLSFNSGIGVVVITAGVPYSERNDVPENALDFVNIDLAKEIVDYITR